MSWVGAERWDIYLGQADAGLARPDVPPRWLQRDDPQAALVELLGSVRHLRTRLLRPRVRLWLSGALARPFLVERVEGLRSKAELCRLAASAAGRVTGLAGPCTAWCDTTAAVGPILAVAVESGLLEGIQARCRDQGFKAVSIRPWWAQAMQLDAHTSRRSDLVIIEDSDSLTLLGSDASDAWSVANAIFPLPEPEAREALVARRVMGLHKAPRLTHRLRLISTEGPSKGIWPMASSLEPAPA